MRLTKKIISITASALGAIVMAAASTTPQAADSNIAAWLKALGVSDPPHAFVTAHADQWAFWLGALILIIGLFGILEWRFARKSKPSAPDNMTAYELSHYLTGESDWGWRVRTYKAQSPEFLRDLAGTIKLNGSMSVPGEFHRVAQVDSNNLRASGTKVGALEPEMIPPVFWTENGLSLESTFVPANSESAPMRAGPATIYKNVRINRADVERLWPRRNIIKRWLTRCEQRKWHGLLDSLPEAPTPTQGNAGQAFPKRHKEILQSLADPLSRLERIAFDRWLWSPQSDATQREAHSASFAEAREAAELLIGQIPYDPSTAQTVRDFIHACSLAADDARRCQDDRESRSDVHRISEGLFRFLHEAQSVDRLQVDLPDWCRVGEELSKGVES